MVSVTNQLKLTVPDGKKRLTDVLDNAGVLSFATCFPNTKASRFVEWFTNSDETIDGRSNSKAYALFESSLIDSIEVGTIKGLQQIHAYLNKESYLDAMTHSVANTDELKALLYHALTDKINDRETFMKGVDYSYYYEQED